jgi:2-phosphosulfolactate phosphatase
VVVVVDVLSFSTAVSVAADRGTAVLPYPWAVTDAAAFARAHDAVLARGRSAGPGEVGLSPVSIRSADPPPQPGEPVRWGRPARPPNSA